MASEKFTNEANPYISDDAPHQFRFTVRYKGKGWARWATPDKNGVLYAGSDNPVRFKLRDDDGDVMFTGTLYGDYHGFEPQDTFGEDYSMTETLLQKPDKSYEVL